MSVGTESLLRLTLESAADLVRTRQVSPTSLVESCLARIESLEPRLNAFITVTKDVAREQAREAEREIAAGHYRGPLHGIPVAVKDLFATKGIRTTAGAPTLPAPIGGRAPRDPAAVDRPVPDLPSAIDMGPEQLRIGVPTDYVWDGCDESIATAVRAAIGELARAGAEVREMRWPRAAEYA